MFVASCTHTLLDFHFPNKRCLSAAWGCSRQLGSSISAHCDIRRGIIPELLSEGRLPQTKEAKFDFSQIWPKNIGKMNFAKHFSKIPHYFCCSALSCVPSFRYNKKVLSLMRVWDTNQLHSSDRAQDGIGASRWQPPLDRSPLHAGSKTQQLCKCV